MSNGANGKSFSWPAIFVGCGGTGLETLVRLNGLFCSNEFWRRRLGKDVYYLFIDTEKAAIKNFEPRIKAQLHGAVAPHVSTIHLSQEMTGLSEAVKPVFDEVRDREGLKRLKDHWWFAGDPEPESAAMSEAAYIAHRINIVDGAGQVPAVSYFLAWKMLDGGIQRTLQDLLRDMVSRRGGETTEAATAGLSLYFVGSLAGGTGRGCWQLIALKLRQLISQNANVPQPKPIGFFLDASCFPGVDEGRANQTTASQIRLNSLTGVSELSCWMEPIHGGEGGAGEMRGGAIRHSTFYRLPSLARPGDREADVLNPYQTPKDPRCNEALHTVFLVFRDSENGFLKDEKVAFDMVGKAMYAMVTEEVIKARHCNLSGFAYWGVGTATIEVPSERLRRCLEASARVGAVEILRQGDAAKVQEFVESLCRRSGLGFLLRDNGAQALSDVVENPDRCRDDLFGAVMRGVTEDKGLKNHFAALSKALGQPSGGPKGKGKESLKDAANLILQLKALDLRRSVEESFEAATQQFGSAGTIRERLLQAFFGAGSVAGEAVQLADDETREAWQENEFGMLGDSCSFEVLRGVAAEIERRAAVFAAPPDKGGLPTSIPVPEHIEPFAEMMKRKSREGFLTMLGPMFSNTDRDEILREAAAWIRYKAYSLVRSHLIKTCAELRKEFEVVRRKIDACCDSLQKAARKEKANRDKEAKDLFLDESGRKPLVAQQLPDAADPIRFVRRTLKLGRPERNEFKIQWARLFRNLVAEVLDQGRRRGAFETLDAQTRDDEIQKRLMNAVAFEGDPLEEYTFEKVASVLYQKYRSYFESIQGNSSEFSEEADRFKMMFGVTVYIDDGRVQFDCREDEFVTYMAASLVRSCRPYWRLRRDQKDGAIKVFLPVDVEDEAQAKGKLTELVGERVDLEMFPVSTSRAQGGGGNPFLILAYVAGCCDDPGDISSLDYWQSDNRAARWLQEVEDPSGRSYFDAAGGNLGRGYTSPVYVRDQKLVEVRWRPWMRGRKAALDERRSRVIQAVFYMLFEPSPETATDLATLRWSMPLVRAGERERFRFERLAYKEFQAAERPGVEPNVPTDTQCGWKTGAELAQSIRNVASRLADPKGAGALAAVERERKIFVEKVLPQLDLSRDRLRQELKRMRENFEQASDNPAVEPEDKAVWDELINLIDRGAAL